MAGKGIFTIGEFMQMSGVSIRTLRYYDSIDLLKPSDYTEGGHRLYSEDDLILLQKIKSMQFLGLSLKDIKNILQENTFEGATLLQALNDQKQTFEAKRDEIVNIISDLTHLISMIEHEDTVHIDVFCAMLQKLMFKEDTESWFKTHFSKEINDELFNIRKRDEIDLDRQWSQVLSEIKQLTMADAVPSSKESQETIQMLLLLMNKTLKGNLDFVEVALPSTEPFVFPNPFTKKEQVFLKEAMEFNKLGYVKD